MSLSSNTFTNTLGNSFLTRAFASSGVSTLSGSASATWCVRKKTLLLLVLSAHQNAPLPTQRSTLVMIESRVVDPRSSGLQSLPLLLVCAFKTLALRTDSNSARAASEGWAGGGAASSAGASVWRARLPIPPALGAAVKGRSLSSSEATSSGKSLESFNASLPF